MEKGEIMTIGEKVKQLRKSKGMSQTVLAGMLNINRNYLSRIETDKSEINSETLIKLADIFSISIDSLLGVGAKNTSNDEKIKQITNSCSYLNDYDLDFIIRMISVMREEYVKNSTNN